ncbi:YafY family protein [Flavobacterium sp. 14A]|uniref:helix-turn-helix transcriptional regulator n=1 Tax=Flavobacterium sp. 14A TaxID=2735896 RepID=UPI00156FA54F|nr:WYL domain-containing protein [Flavobacterium sp. 14A]NRT10870.1 putative DNA-binding transcriptional regulator YafY [Flavobacterium sp. 14A]
MAATQNLNLTQLRRISLLLAYLKDNPYSTLDDIIEAFREKDKQLTERTFYRLNQTLKKEYDILIVFDYFKNGYFFDEENSRNLESFLSLLELVTTAELFSSNLQEKSKTLDYVEFENTASVASIPNFKIILNAIQMQLPITFLHNSFYHLKQEQYNLKPYFLKQYQNRWYVIGETEKGYRTFGIDRLSVISMGSQKFKAKSEEAKELFSNVIGLNYTDHKLERVQLNFHISQKPYLESLPLHRTQKEIAAIEDDSFTVELLIHPNFEFNQQVLKYGSLVKVLEPKWLVEEMKKELKKAVANYK